MNTSVKTISSEDYKGFYYNSPAANLIINTDTPLFTILDVNNAYLTATLSKREDILGKPLFDAFPPHLTEHVQRIAYSFSEALRTKRPHIITNYRYDIPIPGTNNFEERYWTTCNTPILDNNEQVSYLIHSPVDVTELYKLKEKEKITMEALNAQRQQLYSVFMQAPVGIGIFKGPDYRVDLINPPLSEFLGQNMDTLSGNPFFEALPHAKGQGFEALLEQVRLTGIGYSGQATPISLFRNGQVETAYINFVYEPWREIDGTINGVIAVAIEVTQQILALNKIEEAEERARLAIEAINLGTFDLDLQLAKMVTSQRFNHIFGFDEPVARSRFVTAIHPDDRAIRLAAHRKALETGQLFYEARIIWKDGTTHWIRLEGKVYYDAIKTPNRILGTLLDITEQKYLQKQKDDFIGIASHELKTPVTSIKAYAQILERILLKKGDLKEATMIAKMDGQINRLSSLICDLLDVTKMNSGKLQFNNRDFNFDLLVHDLMEDLQRTTEKNIIVENKTAIGMVYGDKDRLGQVITNLINNAIKYSPNSDKIIVQATLSDQTITFGVQDFGIGISKDKLEKVFERFYRVSGDMQYTFPGLGLGLFISSEIIKRGGGKMWVNSIEGKGSVFCFSIPTNQHQGECAAQAE